MTNKRKKKRRSKPIKNNLKEFKLYYGNLRGLKSKEKSLREIIGEENPTLMCLTETHLKLDDELEEFEGYKTIRNDRNGQDGGGVLIAYRKSLENITVEVARDNENCETLWIVIDNKHGQWGTSIRLGVVYAPQECRNRLEVFQGMYRKIEEQIRTGREKSQKVLLLGDLNCKVGTEIDNNKEDVTKSARYLLKIRDQQRMQILNSDKRCKGLWTRVQGEERSVLDYILVSEEDTDNVVSMLIDEEKKFAPGGINELNETVYSDHNIIMCNINWIFNEEEKKVERRIITKRGYEKIKDEMSRKKVSRLFKEGNRFHEKYANWRRQMDKLYKKHSTAVKRRNRIKTTRRLYKARRKIKKEMSDKPEERNRKIARMKLINEYILEEERTQYRRKIVKVVEKLKSKGGINGANTWELMNQLKGRKEERATSIWGKNGEVLEKREEIMERHKEYYSELLQRKQAVTKEEKEIETCVEEWTETVLMIGAAADPILTKREEVESCIATLKKRKCCDSKGWKNEHMIYGGEEMITSLLFMFNEMETHRTVPLDWDDMVIKSIHKKGPMQDMSKKRGLFLTDVVSKLYEKVLKGRNKQTIDNSVSGNQVGGKKERSTPDQVILLADVVRRNRALGRKTYLIFGDAVKCFDKLWLRDCLLELYKSGVAPQDIYMLYMLNKGANIKIRTPVGETDTFECEEIVKQGTIWGPEMCCVTTDSINRIGEDCTSAIGNVLYGILGYVDDVLGAGTAEKIRTCIRNMRRLEILKKYTFGMDKTKYMIIETGKEEDEIIEEEVEGGLVERTEEHEYLGFWVNESGDCELQIQKKDKKLKGEVSTIRSLACVWNVGSMYFCIRLFLFEACIVPSMLYLIEAWGANEKEVEQLEKMQHHILCNLLEVPKTTPYYGLLHETGIWSVKWKLAYRKIMLYHNIMGSDGDRKVKAVVEQQKGEDGSFYEDTQSVMRMLELTGVDEMKKDELKKTIKDKVRLKMEEEIRTMVEKSRKLRFLKNVTFRQAPYFQCVGGEDANLILKLRLNMVDVYGNFKGDITKRRLCLHCKECMDSTEHMVQCSKVSGTKEQYVDILSEQDSEEWIPLLKVVKENLNGR